MYDLIIVGAGAAGLTAAIYAGRKELRTLILTGNNVGGETNSTNDIQNYPGYEGPGPDLMKKFHEQARKWGAEFQDKLVKSVKKDANFSLTLSDDSVVEGKSVILCYGRKRRKLDVPGEDKFFGRGVSTCTTCDAPFYKNKVAAIVGGGNSAVEGALELASIADHVYLIHRRDAFRADEVTVDKMKANGKITLLLDSVVSEIQGDKTVDSVKVKNLNTGEESTIEINGIFLEIGWITDTSFVEGLVETNDSGEIMIDNVCRTKTPGLFACGDLTMIPYKQTVISAGMGAIATLQAYSYITKESPDSNHVK